MGSQHPRNTAAAVGQQSPWRVPQLGWAAHACCASGGGTRGAGGGAAGGAGGPYTLSV
jgi:hypothetical protein